MCDAGRIKHHLKHNLWRQESTVLFVGYQAVGTLGRALIGGAKGSETVPGRGSCERAHHPVPGHERPRRSEGLLKWAGSLQAKPDRVFVTHGEDKVTEIFAEKLWDEFRYPAMAPFSGTVFDLKENEFIEKPSAFRSRRKQRQTREHCAREAAEMPSSDRLVAAGQRLSPSLQETKAVLTKTFRNLPIRSTVSRDKWDR